MLTGQLVPLKDPFEYKAIYFIFVCASVLLVFVYWLDIQDSWFQVQIKKQEPNTGQKTSTR
jgi:hypothetical protein